MFAIFIKQLVQNNTAQKIKLSVRKEVFLTIVCLSFFTQKTCYVPLKKSEKFKTDEKNMVTSKPRHQKNNLASYWQPKR